MSFSLRSRQVDWTSGGMTKHKPIAMHSSRWRECILLQVKIIEGAAVLVEGQLKR